MADDFGGLSPAAFDLIVNEETGGQASYNQTEIHPDWPGGASGVTIGIGYDCGYSDPPTIRNDWDSVLDANSVDALASVAGIHGSPASSHAHELHWISVPWDAALIVFTKNDVPKWIRLTRAALSNFDALPLDCQGALVSLAFNRGVSFGLDGDRYTEMRAIKSHMSALEFKRIPGEFLAMRRLWPEGGDLWRRRGHEADLFTKGLSMNQQPDTAAPAPAQATTPAAAPAVPPWIIFDTNQNTYTQLDRIKALSSNVTIIRYLAAGLEGDEKVIKQGEAHAIADAGFRLGLVYEINGRPSGAAVGARDGAAGKQQATAAGAPTDGSAALYYTVDWDAGPNDLPGIKAAFAAFKAAVAPAFRVGGYASGYICDELYAAGLIELRWLTDSSGFRGTRDSITAGRYELRQLLPRNQAGMDTDPDVVRIGVNGDAVDIGDFVPFATNIVDNDKAD